MTRPSIAAVQARLGLPVTRACRHDWRIKGKLGAGRGGRPRVRQLCASCGARRSAIVSGYFA